MGHILSREATGFHVLDTFNVQSQSDPLDLNLHQPRVRMEARNC